MPEPIRLEINPPFASIILDRPDKRNALSIAMWDKIPAFVATAENDPSVNVLLLAGEGGAFAAGADISEFETIYATEDTATASGRTIAAALDAVEQCPKPVIAAIEGACVGGGVSLAMAADIRLGAEGSKFGVTPGKLGLVYPAGDTRRLLAAVGPSATKDILFTGRIFSASEAKSIGLIDRLVGTSQALVEARALGDEIAAISQWSVRATKRMIAGLQTGWSEKTPEAEALFVAGFTNEDFREGYRAFLEKRAAAFTYR
ncbi:MAG: enoyl-CoA hydratase-related protein [Pseudomonadota bacterium]